jgi:hypothetical protein
MTRDYLRKQARGKPCQVRVPGICDGGGDTTVLAHFRLAGYCGTGIKPDDQLGAWCCYWCHVAVDGQLKTGWTKDALRLMHAEGVMRTLVERAKLEADA